MCHELAQELIRMGHNVIVVTPEPSLNTASTLEVFEGVQVLRFKTGKLKGAGKVRRALNETVLSWRAWRGINSKLKKQDIDAVVYYSPSIFWGPLVKKLKAQHKCKTYLILRDFFPQWAIDEKIIRAGSPIEKYFRYFEAQTYRAADTIGVMSENNLALFKASHNTSATVEVLRNWAAIGEKIAPEKHVSVRAKLNLENKVIFFYGGNIGVAQDMANLMRLARSLRHRSEAHFLFVGAGDEVELVKKLARDWDLQNFTYLPSIQQAAFDSLLSEVDVGLFTLSKNHTTHNFPGKLLGYMAHAKPILGSVNKDNDLMPLLNGMGAGFVRLNGDDEELYRAAEQLLDSSELRKEQGINGLQLLRDEFSVESIAQQILARTGG
ncbi:glycosyltransferase WbuB [Aliidiomarina shirensis]|uniref:Glycosyltransferase WbuB n=2 Tax=Aliidiomarina shirensis TaxID=1048642 RepID=A0A432WVL1_9GAMM|nr:glycosyltransferase WbuB [Aliidiomarina shirensis]